MTDAFSRPTECPNIGLGNLCLGDAIEYAEVPLTTFIGTFACSGMDTPEKSHCRVTLDCKAYCGAQIEADLNSVKQFGKLTTSTSL